MAAELNMSAKSKKFLSTMLGMSWGYVVKTTDGALVHCTFALEGQQSIDLWCHPYEWAAWSDKGYRVVRASIKEMAEER